MTADPALSPTSDQWAVIWLSATEPRVRSYLWTVGFQSSAEAALAKAESEAREETRPNVRTPALELSLLKSPPQLARNREQWAVMWKHRGQPRTRHMLFGDPQPSAELALEKAQAELVALGNIAPEAAVSWLGGTFYPVRLDLCHRGREGTFYPVLVTRFIEIYEDPTKPRLWDAGGRVT